MKDKPTVKKTINEVFEEFLEEQKQRLKPRTMNGYYDTIHLFRESLNGYGHTSLDKNESSYFYKIYNANDKDNCEFCDIFGPEKIAENVEEFFSYFMVRKVMCGKDMLKTTGTVIKKLSKWLAEKGYVERNKSKQITNSAEESGKDLVAANQLRTILFNECNCIDSGNEDDKIEGHFIIEDVLPKKLIFFSCEGGDEFTMSVPKSVSDICKIGWAISGVIGFKKNKAFFQDVWNVYP